MFIYREPGIMRENCSGFLVSISIQSLKEQFHNILTYSFLCAYIDLGEGWFPNWPIRKVPFYKGVIPWQHAWIIEN